MDNIYLTNFTAFKKRDSFLGQLIEDTKLSDRFKSIESKSGNIVPVISSEGRDYPLHSKFRPIEEGIRFASNYTHHGTFIFFGFGGGYHIEPFLQSKGIEQIFIVIIDLSLFKAVMGQRDLTLFINDSRLRFIIGEEANQIVESIQGSYIPLLSGTIQTIPLKSIIRFYNERMESLFDTVSSLIDNVKSDFSVQYHFGKQWFHNSLKNLFRLASYSDTTWAGAVCIPSQVIITAAGPSLESQIVKIKSDYISRFLIATDTSVPVLLKFGIKPDLIVSIDCQVISRSHFLSMPVRDIPIILDIASSGSVVDQFDHPVFCGSRHPFAHYLVSKGIDLPLLNFSGGSVTHAAIEAAHYGGADDIILAGADFAYPWGKSYARGSHLYDYFSIRAGRELPLEQGFYSILMRSPFESRQTDFGKCYIPKRMDCYKSELESLAQVLFSECKIEALEGEGQKLSLPVSLDPHLFSSGKLENKNGFNFDSLYQFLLEYSSDLKALEDLTSPLITSFQKLNEKERSLWLTIIPYAARFSSKSDKYSSSQVLSKAKCGAIDFISALLNGNGIRF